MIKPSAEAIKEIGFIKGSNSADYGKQIEMEKSTRRYFLHAAIEDGRIKFRRPCKGRFTQKDVDSVLDACGDFATMILKGNE